MDIFDCDLKPVEGAGFRQLDLRHETLRQILHDDTVTRREERENHRYEISLVVIQRDTEFPLY